MSYHILFSYNNSTWKVSLYGLFFHLILMHLFWVKKSLCVVWKRFETFAATAKSLQSCPTLCNPTDSRPLGSAVPGILQARTLEWVAISFSNAWKWKVKVKSLSCVWLFVIPWTACSLPGSSVHGSFQTRVLEWGARAFSVKHLLKICNFLMLLLFL